MSDADLLRVVSEHLRTFQHSVFRLETLDEYTSDAESEEMRRWLAGELLVPPPEDDEYLRLVRAARAAARPWQRVHVVTGPTPYLRFEIEAYYGDNEAAGEVIGILQHPSPASVFGEAPPDFWLFDDQTVIEMQYDLTGRIAAVPVIVDVADISRYQRLRDVALHHAVPLREYRAALRRQAIPSPALPVEAA